MRHLLVALVFGAIGTTAHAATIIDFEGLNDTETVEQFYNGGLGGLGSGPGPNLGITFSSNGQALIDEDAGGTGNFGDEPSPDTVLFWLNGSGTVMDVAGGFTTTFSVFYSAEFQSGTLTIWDQVGGMAGGGVLLATLNLPTTEGPACSPAETGTFCPFVPIGIAFAGVARSVDFSGTENQIGFDNIELGQLIPVPAAVWLFGSALGLLGWMKRRQAE